MPVYMLAFIIAAGVALLVTPGVICLAGKTGAMDAPDARKVHKKPIPRIGGIGIYVAFMVAILSVLAFTEVSPEVLYEIIGLLVGGSIIFIVGLIDDYVNLPAKVKLLGQIIAACVLVFAFDVRIDFITDPFGDYIYLEFLAIPATIFWLVGLTNTVNLIDGLDGLACGVSTISAISMLVIALLVSESDVALVMAALVGACLGFMPYNKNPAKMFMGDTGSTFLGYILATISIQGLFKYYAIVSFAVPFLILGLPMFDTLFAIIRRLAHGQNPMAPDRGHIHHRLIDMGLNQKQAVAALYVISSILGLSAVMLTSSGAIKAMLFLMALAVAAFLASRVIFRRDIDKALQAEKAAAKNAEAAAPAENEPEEPEEESNEKKKEEA